MNIYQTRPVKIKKIIRHTPQEWSFFLKFSTSEEPGRFVMLSVPGVGEAPISVSGFTASGIELTIRNIGQVTSAIFAKKEGDYLCIRGPYGNVFPLERFSGKHLLIIAGGSGVAAVKSVIEYFLARKRHCPLGKLDILVGFKSPRHVLFRQDMKKWISRARHCDVRVTVDTAEDEEEEWLGGIGFVVEFIKEVKDIGTTTHVIVVGPPLMMTNCVRELVRCGVKEENIWLSFERHMKCGVGKCGHCRIGDKYVCVDGPVFSYEEAKGLID